MSMTDTLADMITRIRNGQQAQLYNVHVIYSKFHCAVLEVLKKEGYIKDYQTIENANGHQEIKVDLKYSSEGKAVIQKIKRISKPGRRSYSKIADLQKCYSGLGIFIISTPKGVMSDYEARQSGVGGEVLCMVF